MKKKYMSHEQIAAFLRELDDVTLSRIVPVANVEERRRIEALGDAQRRIVTNPVSIAS